MCGFVGQFRFNDARSPGADREQLRRLVALAARRGPDDEGVWSDGRHCDLGFRRLSIFDPSAASHQPMLSQDGRYAIVYNGALYNFRPLRRDLESAGVRFRSRGDTEVVLAALTTWGSDALRRFNGMFALAFYDSQARRLVLARDHAGMKPLYYLLSPHGVAFASQYDQILQHPWSAASSCSGDAVGLYLRLGYIPAPYALLGDSHQVTPGAWVEIDVDGRQRSGRFFAYPPDQEPDLSGAEADEAIGAAIDAAVRRHLVADVPVGTFLSGGIDSPLIAATAQAVADAPLCAFTLGTGGDVYDESADAATYANAIGIEHVVDHLTPERALALVDDVVSACSEPFADYSLFPTLFVSRLARERVAVALSGDGGDELFWGYVGRCSALLRRLDPPLGPEEGRIPLERLLRSTGVQHGRWPSTIGELHRLNHLNGTEGWFRRIFPDLPPWPADFPLFTFDSRDVDATARWLRWNEMTGYLTMILQKVDRGSMFHGLEVRAPLLDREVIAVALRIDWRTCLDVQHRIGKLPLRRALARRVAQQSWAKRGFTVPMNDWLRGPLRPLFEDTVATRTDLVGLSIDRTALRDLYDRHLRRQADHGWVLWILLSLALWQQRHGRARSF